MRLLQGFLAYMFIGLVFWVLAQVFFAILFAH